MFNHLGSEVEPWVAVDPTDGNHLIGGTRPGCRALSSVVSPADLAPTDANATDVYAAVGS